MGGVVSNMQGGNFEQSFLTAAISSIAAGGYGMLGSATQTGVGQILFGTLVGGLTAEFQQKGNFWQGAVTGLIVGLINHASKPFSKAIDKLLTLNRINNALVAMGLKPCY